MLEYFGYLNNDDSGRTLCVSFHLELDRKPFYFKIFLDLYKIKQIAFFDDLNNANAIAPLGVSFHVECEMVGPETRV